MGLVDLIFGRVETTFDTRSSGDIVSEMTGVTDEEIIGITGNGLVEVVLV